MLNALALAAIVMVAAPAFAAGEPAVPPSAIDGAAANPPAAAVDGPSGKPVGSEQSGSTLGALVLGVLGLLWVRRHTGDL